MRALSVVSADAASRRMAHASSMTSVATEKIVWSPTVVARRIQHTLIRADATSDDVVRHCRECLEYGFDAAMVSGDWVPLARAELRGSRVKTASALDFPVAAMTTAGRIAEACALVAAGADEIDVGCKIGWLRSGRDREFHDDLAAVVRAAAPARVKVMLELPMLTMAQRERAVALAVEAGVAFVKNASSGAVGRATPAQIRFLRDRVPAGVGVKASGGIGTYDVAVALLDAGADLLGSSSGVAIATGEPVSGR
jgi:deoxyribose-phosphate aldolase